MLPLLLLIEIFSYIIRMFSLAIRLVANIMAGHTLIYIIATFSFLILSINFFFGFIGISLICTIMLLELVLLVYKLMFLVY
jgi:F0F1-type ATP synthase membrane subunit a